MYVFVTICICSFFVLDMYSSDSSIYMINEINITEKNPAAPQSHVMTRN